MTVDIVTIVGAAATITSISLLLPTLIKQCMTKRPIVEPMLVVQALISNVVWIIYGWLRGDIYIIVSSGIAGTISVASLAMCLDRTEAPRMPDPPKRMLDPPEKHQTN